VLVGGAMAASATGKEEDALAVPATL